ncbi:hypothetical protein J7413_07755 [Shimia sp. R10_1]|uniref:hypothetical protein n=1 Tax=Shimia sp. R10_1 TaxID=2821095 RepID=UPI001ADCCE82|nr:hypothetical protein [Shimia sp. R10_1]MBO9473431.1 hypothetical protein [Shimia sp. R10_1]
MEAILNVIWRTIDIVPPVITASIMMLCISAVAGAALCLFVAALAMRREKRID